MAMKRIYRSKYSFIVAVSLVVLMSVGKCYAKGIVIEWSPFISKTELELLAVSVPFEREVPLGDDAMYKKERAVPIEPNSTDEKNSDMQEVIKFHNVSISFSRMVVHQTHISALEPLGEGSDKLSEFKTLPSTFLTLPYRDALESIGRIFEPQVNLRIEF
jgi:hypothetical protein